MTACFDAALAGATTQRAIPLPDNSQYGSDDADLQCGRQRLQHGVACLYRIADQSGGAVCGIFSDLFPPGRAIRWRNCVPTDKSLLGSNQTMSAYESGAGDDNGPGSTEQSYLSQAGFPSAMWMAETWLLGAQALMPIQNAFNFSQSEFNQGGPMFRCGASFTTSTATSVQPSLTSGRSVWGWRW